jgi:hypothetical protein
MSGFDASLDYMLAPPKILSLQGEPPSVLDTDLSQLPLIGCESNREPRSGIINDFDKIC